ncbi:DUF6814 family protein [Niabella sp. CJ426]|uniref:DUF6814 family protein n=1 Tax=Niabella sp. CJ426 TaxID=3393740 RepID=UPI003CFEFB53
MNVIKRILGVIWFLLGPSVTFFLIAGAVKNIDSSGNKDINNPVIWVIIIAIFVPIAIGLMIFGWYAIKNEYEHLPEDSDHLNFE